MTLHALICQGGERDATIRDFQRAASSDFSNDRGGGTVQFAPICKKNLFEGAGTLTLGANGSIGPRPSGVLFRT